MSHEKTVFAFLAPLPRVVEGWNLYVWQWIFKAHLPVTSKPAPLLQNRHFAETLFGVLTKVFPTKLFVANKCFACRKMKCRGSPETCFPKVLGWSESSSGVNGRSKFRTSFWRGKMKCWGSSETRFGKVWSQTEPSLKGKRLFKVWRKIEIREAFWRKRIP